MLKALAGKAGVWFYAIFYGAIVLVTIAKDIVTLGYRQVFNKIKRERPAILQDENLGTHGFLHLEDVRIHYVAKGPEDKPLMLFVHGFPDFWFTWKQQLLEFSNDYRCVAIDMRGYGESDKPSGIANYQMKYLMKDLHQIIDALGHTKCTLVAHDWGGAVAWSFAKNYPADVEKLIVMNCPPGRVFQKVIMTKKQFKMSWYMFFFQLPYLPELMIGLKDFASINGFGACEGGTFSSKSFMVNPLPDEEVEAYKYTLSQPGALTPPINYYRASMRMPAKRTDLDYAMPVLLIWGMKDHALCDDIPTVTEKEAPTFTVKRIENSGHFVQMDTPKEVNAIMTEWLAIPLSPPPSTSL